jgi:hypothetical protein
LLARADFVYIQLDEVVDDASDDEKKGRSVDDVSNDKLIQAAKKKKTKVTKVAK